MELFIVRCDCGHAGRVRAAQLERALTCLACGRTERPYRWEPVPVPKPGPAERRRRVPSEIRGAPSPET
jgi:hypothetical protein